MESVIGVQLNSDPSTLRVGDKVTSDFRPRWAHVVRTITRIEVDKKYGSGYSIWADNGGQSVCPHCQQIMADPISGVDGAWFLPVVP